MIKILFCGDVVGKSGRNIITENINSLKKTHNIDFIIVNAENSAHGFGITPKIANDFLNLNIDVITLGNHFFDQPSIGDYLNENNNSIIRPLNYKGDFPGKGYCIKHVKGISILCINLMGNLFMGDKCTNAFVEINDFLKNYKLKHNVDIIFVDFHAEATSEKNALGLFLDGRVSAIIGTHSHIPTSDTRILPKGTGYQTDVGMCGDYNSVIGMTFESSIPRFMNNFAKSKLQPATNGAIFCSVLIEINEKTGLVEKINNLYINKF